MRPAGADLHFAHALIRDGAYESLLKPRRLALHRRAGDCFAERDPGLQARDLELAEDDEAPEAYLAAARHHDSVLQFEAALALIARGRALVAPDDIAFELVCLEGDILRAAGRSIEAINGLRAAAASAQGGAQVCRVEIAIAQAACQASRYEDALASLARAESSARALDWPKELATIHYLRSAICFPLGRIDESFEANEAALGEAERAGSVRLQVGAISGFGDANFMRGTMRSAVKHYTRAIDLARAPARLLRGTVSSRTS